jgi:DNA-binding winged helix-turn-helix (wHTH) protein
MAKSSGIPGRFPRFFLAAMRYVFNDLCLDLSTRQLLRRGRARRLEPKAFELLALLLSRRPQAVSKPEIQQTLWPGTFVSESSLTSLVTQIRQALRDDPREPRYLRTVHGFGYAFSGIAAEEETDPVAGRSACRRGVPAARVLTETKAFALAEGENVLGRDPAVTVYVDQPGVSRRHARIVLAGGNATLEDLGSKNGTFLRDDRVTAATPLVSGDLFRLGRHVLEFRVGGAASTRTEVGTDRTRPGGS